MYMPVPVAGVGMIVFELEQIFQHIEEFFTLKNPEGKEAQA
jgi:TRAP-type C4-dicarboxylate transport system permease small subunit